MKKSVDLLSPLRALVDGKSVALVGNSSSRAPVSQSAEVDKHEVVIRMNLGLPHKVDTIGKRTTIWATAKYWPGACPDDAELVLFMKRTALGEQHYKQFCMSSLPCAMLRWTQNLEDECREFVGADPGTGIRLFWWLKLYALPLTVSLYGFDFWATPSNWSGRRNTPNHSPQLEYEAFQRLLLE